jgi:hypothetical protein
VVVVTCTVCFNLYCGCCNLFRNVWVRVRMGFLMCECVYVWVCVCVGVLVIYVLVFTVFCIVCILFFVLFRSCLVCTSVRTTATE